MPRQPLSPKQLRILWIIFVVAALVSIAVTELVVTTYRPVGGLYWIIVVFALWSAVGSLRFRKKFIDGSAARLKLNPNDLDARKKWSAGSLACFSAGYGTVLWGLLARFQGFSRTVTWPLFGLGLIVLFLSIPQRAETP